jgi:hypothetical protein
VRPGEIYRYEDFYFSRETGALEPKYLVVLSLTPDADIIARLLTSRVHGRPEHPPCYHGYPYPGFYLGVIGGALGAKTWVDLRGLDDLDGPHFERHQRRGRVVAAGAVARPAFVTLLECVAAADDTTVLQERSFATCWPGSGSHIRRKSCALAPDRVVTAAERPVTRRVRKCGRLPRPQKSQPAAL